MDVNIYDGALECPMCYGAHLHQRKVAVGFRRVEDEPLSHVAVTDKSGTSLQAMPLHGRRDAVSLHFYCEACRKTSCLRIWQHKGSTIVDWEASDA